MNFCRFALVSLLALTLPALLPAGTVLNESAFVAQLAPGSYLETFDSLTSLGSSQSFSGGGFSYDAAASNGLYTGVIAGDRFLGNVTANDAVTFSFGSGVTAVGGRFAATDLFDFLLAADITVTLGDGSSYTLPNQNGYGFVGFTSLTPISSLTVSSSQTGGASWLAIDNFYVGAAAGAGVPEPASVVLAAAGCALVALLRRCIA